ncbi:MAG: hypothetical protein ACRD1N_11985 [Terriglobia bacterium]
MAWGDSPSDPDQLRLMREAGLNVSGFCELADLEKVSAAGLSCFVTDPRVKGYQWDHMPAQDVLRRNIAPVARVVRENPAALGFFLDDEPGAASYPGLARVADLLKHAAPGKWPYINLLPSYASRSQLGAANYEDYVREYIRTVHPPFLSYDNYSLLNGRMDERFYVNLEIIRRMALEAGIPFWNIILANSHYSYMEPTDATLRLQVYSTLAYGGRGIEYFTYITPDAGNFRLAAIDAFGHRTPTWYMLRRVNDEVRVLAPWLVKLHSTGVYHSAPAPPQSKPISASAFVEHITAHVLGAQPRFLLGEFADGQGAPYLMLVNEDLSRSMNFQITLRAPAAKLQCISPYSGEPQPLDSAMEWLAPGAGVLLRVQQ